MREPTAGPKARPFLKWAGGKKRSAHSLVRLAPPFSGRYWEPFMGSAAVFFELAPERAALSDLNEELVICFREVARDPFAIMDSLDEMPNTKEHYMQVRRTNPQHLTPSERASRVIYLNKTAFRGLWRVNRSGEFNVPYGQYQRPYYNRDNMIRASKALAHALIQRTDFGDVLREARAGDWVYLDPPYVPDRPWGDFKRYTPDQFHEQDHVRLAEEMEHASRRGVLLMLTNSDTPFVRDLFYGWNIEELRTRRDIHLKSSERASRDLVIMNYTEFREPPLSFREFKPSIGAPRVPAPGGSVRVPRSAGT